MWATLYALLLAALVVRIRATDVPSREPIWPVAGEPLWLTRLHHGLFLLLLLGPPLESAVWGGSAVGRGVGALLFGSGVMLYRVAGRMLGDALSPFTEPRPAAPLVTAGLYRYLRHPMYLSEALISVGAPLALGSRRVIAFALPALLVLGTRILREEEALARTFPEYARYAATTKRIVPFLY
jgi:protein-S-isoprenylcysteine O-methyltransferase Ste14